MWSDLRSQLTDSLPAGIEELKEILRIPSVSTEPQFAADVRRCGEWVAERMRRAGVPSVEFVETPRHPIILGKWHAAPGKPTILVYGHYDVQPVDPLNEWISDPFTPTERDGLLYARGVADMKGNLVALLQAVDVLAHSSPTGAPPVNLTFLWEGEEEIGSPSAPDVVSARADDLKADVVMSCDGGMADEFTPALWISFKGMAAVELAVETATSDLHSGGFGAWVPNAAQVLASIASQLHTDDGKIAVPGFYDGISEPDDAARAEIASMALPNEVLFTETGVSVTWGEPGFTAEERRAVRPTLDINGFWSGFQGEGSKTVTPCRASMKITCRLVPGQDPDRIARLIAEYAATLVPAGVRVIPTFYARNGAGYSIPRTNPFLLRLTDVLEDAYDRPVRVTRVGGSVPITAMFKERLGLDTVSLGFLMPNANLHAPNEWLRLTDFARGREIYARYLSAW